MSVYGVDMIAREWRCICPAEKIEDFIPYLHETGVRDAESTAGFRGAEILQRELDGAYEVVLITFWDSVESIKGFSGDDIEKAVLYPEDYKYGITSEPTVRHYSVRDRF